MGKIKKFLHRNVYPILFYMYPINNKKIVITSYAGDQYADSPRVLSEEIKRLRPNTQIVWLFNDCEMIKKDIPSYITCVKNESFRAAYELYTAKVWIDNCRKPLFFPKRKKQVYIQCWHGTPLKLIENDAGMKLSRRYRKYGKRDSKNIDLLISGNTYSTEIFKRAFNYKKEILECGTPRNDILINNPSLNAKRTKEKLNILDKKIILYAPTFRNEKEKNGLCQLEKLNIELLIQKFKVKFNQECIILVRYHPNVSKQINQNDMKKKYGSNIIDVSLKWDMQDLLCVADALITDYSSVIFDYALLKRPIFIFAYDKEDYYKERGLYLDVTELPVVSAKNYAELEKILDEESITSLIEKTNKLLRIIGNKELGNSTKQITEFIIDKIDQSV